jgi:hypothetical protein
MQDTKEEPEHYMTMCDGGGEAVQNVDFRRVPKLTMPRFHERRLPAVSSPLRVRYKTPSLSVLLLPSTHSILSSNDQIFRDSEDMSPSASPSKETQFRSAI